MEFSVDSTQRKRSAYRHTNRAIKTKFKEGIKE